MTSSILCRVPVLGKFFDEGFLPHRCRSTSLAGVVGLCAAAGLFDYRYVATQVWSWDLFAVIGTFAVVKMGMMAWYRLRG